MKEILVKLSSLEDVRQFVAMTARCPCPLHVVSEDKLPNAKSLIGFFSMDLTKPVTVRVEDEQAEIAPFLSAIRPYLV